jgi:hypothetical protein
MIALMIFKKQEIINASSNRPIISHFLRAQSRACELLTATVAAISGNGAEPGDDLQSAC